MWLLVGLGNPGPKYEDTRHNAGFLVVDEVVRRWGLPSLRAQLGARVCRGEVAGYSVLIAQPQSYMNCSGAPVEALLRFYKGSLDRMIVVHDDLDLDFGAVRVKRGGGHGGHNGLRDLGQHLGLEFLRVRVGISRPPRGGDSADYVLGPWSEQERTGLVDVVAQSAEAVETVLSEGASAAMNRFNVRPRTSVAEGAGEDSAQATDRGSSGGRTSISSVAGEEPPPVGAPRPAPGQGVDHA